MSSSNCYVLTCIQISQEAGQVVWYSHLFQNFPQFIVIHTVKGFGILITAEINVFLELTCFFHDPAHVGNLICLFWKQLEHLEVHGSHIAEAWLWELSITLLACKMSTTLSILWHCLSLGLEWKLTFSSPVATAEVSKFAGILSVALSQHHLSGFEIPQ